MKAAVKLYERSEYHLELCLFTCRLLRFGRKGDSVNSTAFGGIIAIALTFSDAERWCRLYTVPR